MFYREFNTCRRKNIDFRFRDYAFSYNNNQASQIDDKEASKMLEYGINNGINIINTVYSYHTLDFDEPGERDPFLGDFLSTRYRKKVLFSTKLASWIVKKKKTWKHF